MAIIDKNTLLRAFLRESATVTVMFAAVFPALVLFYSLAFDGARLNNKRARLMDGVNQGVTAVALTDNRHLTTADQQVNKRLLGAYTRYYLPGETIPEDQLTIAVSTINDSKGRLASVDYAASAQADVRMILSGSGDVGMGPVVKTTADSGAGVIRKTIDSVGNSTDFVFVTDFSTSMLGTRIKTVKQIIAAFTDQALGNGNVMGNTIGIVPYSIGTPVVLNNANLVGGNAIGCSFVGKLKDQYSINFDYWFDKRVRTFGNESIQRAAYEADWRLYSYYYDIIVRRNISPATLAGLTSRGWCQSNSKYGASVGRGPVSCEADPALSIFSSNEASGPVFSKEFSDNYRKAAKLMGVAYDNYNIVNAETLDIDATLADGFLFSDSAITTYMHMHAYYELERPFPRMCVDALTTYTWSRYGERPDYYPIELTGDPAALDIFQTMTPNGLTDSINGLLRAVPVIAKGTNPRKVIIILTDGEDTGANSWGPLELRNLLIKDKDLCGVIKRGLLEYPRGTQTKSAEIYYFSLTTDATRMKFWADNCVGAENSIVAKNYQQLMEALTAINKKGGTKFVNKNEEVTN